VQTIEVAIAEIDRQSTHAATLWIEQGRRVPLLLGLWRSVGYSWQSYVVAGECLRGFRGFMRAYLDGLGQLITYAKYWERRTPHAAPSVPTVTTARVPARSVPLSVVIITKNEEARIAECLASVMWAAEVVVVDDHSTDRTRDVAAHDGARVLLRTMDIEGRHRNWAYAQATQPWVLSLDADERVTPALAEEIAAVIQNGDAGDGFDVPRRNYIGTRWVQHGGWYPAEQLKLFRHGAFHYEEMEIHPKSHFEGRHGRTLQYPLEHFSYRDFGDFLAKLNRQTTLEAQKWLREGRRVSVGKAAWRALDRGLRTYCGKGGYRDGFLGLMVATLATCYQLVSFAKYHEAKRQTAGSTSP